MEPREKSVEHAAAARYEATRTLARRYVKEYRLDEQAFLWAVWFVFNGDQCGTRCPYRQNSFVGSDLCTECPAFEGIQIVTKATGRVYCKKKRATVTPMPDIYFLPDGPDRSDTPATLPDELCPW